MGSLVPGASYVYESADGVIYARLSGEKERKVIGYTPDKLKQIQDIDEHTLWYNIRQEAKNNPALQLALDRAIMLYNLSRYENERQD